MNDCRSVLTELLDATADEAPESPDAPWRRRILRKLHTVKGAAAFLELDAVANSLHAIEGMLTDQDAVEHTVLRDSVRQALSLLADDDVAISTEAAVEHRVGEALWWANELIQSTARRLGKRVFIVVRGGDLVISERTHQALQATLQHLVRNAIVHGIEGPDTRERAGKPAAGLITIAAGRSESGVWVSVTDNGAGITEQIRPTLFQFGQTTAAKADLDAGRGLGLATVHDVAVDMGGRVECESREGEGTSFTLHLPDPG
ncbi:ATP-binding protein [Minwuia sp.]|uniref:ATP-binding protein n=1 Tax=Minwuia sp. TaxID=2493630 RepID=UPI003A8E9755